MLLPTSTVLRAQPRDIALEKLYKFPTSNETFKEVELGFFTMDEDFETPVWFEQGDEECIFKIIGFDPTAASVSPGNTRNSHPEVSFDREIPTITMSDLIDFIVFIHVSASYIDALRLSISKYP